MLEYVTRAELDELNELHADENPRRKCPRNRDRAGNRKRKGTDEPVVRARIVYVCAGVHPTYSSPTHRLVTRIGLLVNVLFVGLLANGN